MGFLPGGEKAPHAAGIDRVLQACQDLFEDGAKIAAERHGVVPGYGRHLISGKDHGNVGRVAAGNIGPATVDRPEPGPSRVGGTRADLAGCLAGGPEGIGLQIEGLDISGAQRVVAAIGG